MAVKKGSKGSGDPFAKAAAKARGRFNEAKKVKDGFTGGLEFGEIEDGDYPARLVKAVCGVTKKGEGDIYISLDFVFTDSEHEGKEVNIFQDLSTDKKAEALCRTLKRLDYELGDDLDPADLPDIVKDLNASPPSVILNVANKETDAQGKAFQDGPRAYCNIQRTTKDVAPTKKASKKPAAKGKKK